MIKKIIRLPAYFITSILCLASGYTSIAVILGLIPVNSKYIPGENGTRIYIATNRVHLDIIIPVATKEIDWREVVPPEQFAGDVSECRYIGFGRGERNFYINTPTWADLKLSTAIKAMLWPTPAAMHVNYYPNLPPFDEYIISISLSDSEYNELTRYIYRSFKIAEDKGILIAGAAYGLNDNFYEANGKYHMFFTSNDWVNTGLKKIGVRACVWSPFDRGVLFQLRRIEN